MKRTIALLALTALLFTSCNNKPTLQTYFVDKAEDKNFMALDIAPSFIKTDKMQLTTEEQTALKSLKNVNIIAFKANDKNVGAYEKELENVKKILKDDSYEELIKFNRGAMGASINTKGVGDNVDELILFANSKASGFGVVRVTGENMTPANVMTIVGLLQKSNLDMEQLKPLKEMIDRK
jgi:hypothetical protein